MFSSRAIANSRIRLGPASRAAAHDADSRTKRFDGTSPFTAPEIGVGRLAGVIGLSAPAAPADTNPAHATATRTTANCAQRFLIRRIQSPGQPRCRKTREFLHFGAMTNTTSYGGPPLKSERSRRARFLVPALVLIVVAIGAVVVAATSSPTSLTQPVDT